MEKLSEVISNNMGWGSTYVKCSGCNKIYIDDIVNYGSILSPCCNHFALERGLTQEDITSYKKPEPING